MLQTIKIVTSADRRTVYTLTVSLLRLSMRTSAYAQSVIIFVYLQDISYQSVWCGGTVGGVQGG